MSRRTFNAPFLGLLLHKLGLERAARISLDAKRPDRGVRPARELGLGRAIAETEPRRELPPRTGFASAAFCRSAQEVGGDLFEALPLREDRCLLLLADVMGKGAPAARFVPLLRETFRKAAAHTQRPGDLLACMNRRMFEELSIADVFITALLVLTDSRRSSLTVASAGHCPVLLANKKAGVRSISPDGVPLGIQLESHFTEQRVPFPASTAALLYTDGLTEARNREGEFFGEDRLAECLYQGVAQQMDTPHLQQHLLAEVDRFVAGGPAQDDQAFVILMREQTPAFPLPEAVGTRQAPRPGDCSKRFNSPVFHSSPH